MCPDFPWLDDFAGLEPGSDAFTANWNAIAAAQPHEFQQAQHEFIKRTHFDPLVKKIRSEDGLDVTTGSHALQDVVWSTAVQHGPNSVVVHRALATLETNGELDVDDPAFDRDVITAIYAERGRRDAGGALVHFARSSPAVQEGVAKRFVAEPRDALQMLTAET